MNLVGKILTVLVFVMSLVFMSFAVAVYATHQNWKDVVMLPADQVSVGRPLGLTHQLKAKEGLNQELVRQKKTLEADLDTEINAKTQALTKLEAKYKILETECNEAKKKVTEQDQRLREEVAVLDATHRTLAELRKQVEQLRALIGTAQKARENHFKEVVRLTDELNNAELEQEQLANRQKTLAADHSKAIAVLRKFGLEPEPSLYDGQPPDGVEGVVAAVPQRDLVEINIGSHDGLQVGHKLHVFRLTGASSTYVGRVEVVKTDFDKAACKVDPNYRQSDIREGDRVASKLQ